MITISNDKITAQIAEKGAELKSLKYNGFEYIWEANPDVWGSSSPVLFPICGGLKDDKYFLDGKEYNLNKHGFVRREFFDVETAEKDKAVFLYKSNDMTREKFPFEFELRVIFALCDTTLNVTFDVKNLSDDDMYFNVGAHPAFACPEGISSYDLIFENKENFDAFKVHGNLLSRETDSILKNTDVFPLHDDLFAVDSLMFEDLKSKSVVLKNKINERTVKFEYKDIEFLTVWTKPNAKYICLEPWSGTPDFEGTSYDLKEKFGINKIAKNEPFTRTYSITL